MIDNCRLSYINLLKEWTKSYMNVDDIENNNNAIIRKDNENENTIVHELKRKGDDDDISGYLEDHNPYYFFTPYNFTYVKKKCRFNDSSIEYCEVRLVYRIKLHLNESIKYFFFFIVI